MLSFPRRACLARGVCVLRGHSVWDQPALRAPRTPTRPPAPSISDTHAWPGGRPGLRALRSVAVCASAGRATHGGRGEPLRAGHREPQLPVRLPVQLVRPQEARPCGRKSGPSVHQLLQKPWGDSSGQPCPGPCNSSPHVASHPTGKKTPDFPLPPHAPGSERSEFKSSLPHSLAVEPGLASPPC